MAADTADPSTGEHLRLLPTEHRTACDPGPRSAASRQAHRRRPRPALRQAPDERPQGRKGRGAEPEDRALHPPDHPQGPRRCPPEGRRRAKRGGAGGRPEGGCPQAGRLEGLGRRSAPGLSRGDRIASAVPRLPPRRPHGHAAGRGARPTLGATSTSRLVGSRFARPWSPWPTTPASPT